MLSFTAIQTGIFAAKFLWIYSAANIERTICANRYLSSDVRLFERFVRATLRVAVAIHERRQREYACEQDE